MKNIKETANELGISVMTVRRLIGSKKIKAVKILSSWRISEEEIEKIKKEGVE